MPVDMNTALEKQVYLEHLLRHNEATPHISATGNSLLEGDARLEETLHYWTLYSCHVIL